MEMNSKLIAPCGMNCSLCLAHFRDKKKCLGCNGSDAEKPIHCAKCRIKNCEHITSSESKLCFECGKFPCTRIKQLDKRYRTNYGMSMIENLLRIRDQGMDEFIKNEEERWECKSCGATICVHRKSCVNCNLPREDLIGKGPQME